MKLKKLFSPLFRRQGIALITVVALLALATVLMLALFSTTENEFKATKGYVASQEARLLADTAANVVIGQLQKAANQPAGENQRTIHATQPGAARQYYADGQFRAGYKLYSDPVMEIIQDGVTGERNFAGAVPPSEWDTKPAQYTDLNEPVVRATATGGASGEVKVYFPIVDPRSYTTNVGTNLSVEGFSYQSTPDYSSTSGIRINGVITPVDAAGIADNQRLPMPVAWLYILQDGTLGTLDDSNKFIPAPGGNPASITNPITGRVAFWADDECCKVNVNTASEPTFWGVPRFYHEREHEWAEKPPVAREYQRFPGHPATVALSSVLYPNPLQNPTRDLVDIFGKNTSDRERAIAIKELIYDMIPKIASGGSKSGTKVFSYLEGTSESIDDEASKVDLTGAARERLFASLDELLFSEDKTGNLRVENSISDPSGGSPIFDSKVLERTRFFLTAQSRAPEFSILGVPRISMWPICETDDASHRTAFDQLIGFCSSLKTANASNPKNNYFFQRLKSHDANYDINITRNKQLMEYLLQLLQTTLPSTGVGPVVNSMEDKYGNHNVRNLAVELFDYIRSTNLYDDILAPSAADPPPAGKGALLKVPVAITPLQVYTQNNPTYNTFTNPLMLMQRTKDGSFTLSPGNQKFIADNGWPGHGQVTPSLAGKLENGGIRLWSDQSETYRGFGRNLTISEIGLQIICTADGKNDADSFRCPAVGDPSVISGGATCDRINTRTPNQYLLEGVGPGKAYPYADFPQGAKSVWYSNFPPYPSPGRYGTYPATAPDNPRNPNRHPGYDPLNWNMTLARDTPLAEDEKRVQAMLNLELFCPSEGWTLIHPEFTIVLDGVYVNGITIQGQSLFQTSKPIVFKSRNNVFTPLGVSRTGGVSPPRALLEGLACKGLGDMPNDKAYETAASTSIHSGMGNLNFISNFITVKRDADMAIKFPANGGLEIKIYDTHNWENTEAMQKLTVNFAAIGGAETVTTPTPKLAITSKSNSERAPNGGKTFQIDTYVSGKLKQTRAVEGPRFWAFNADGAIGRLWRDGDYNPEWINVKTVGAGFPTIKDDGNGYGERGLGRFTAVNGYSTIYDQSSDGLGVDIIRSVIPAMGDYRLVAGRYDVPSSIWAKHRFWNDINKPLVHNFSSHTGNSEPSVDLGDSAGMQFMQSLSKNYQADKVPDMPRDPDSLSVLNSYFDFDNGEGSARDGAYINKPDEGNFSKLTYKPSATSPESELRNAYFTDSEMEPDKTGDDRYFTPNRMISSPVMFGSLPTAVFDGQKSSKPSGYGGPGRPWQTLLFRPHVKYINPNVGEDTHPGAQNPPDHYILDMFNMPVVEPYAISEPLSQAGKININYQILPFTYIKRSTGLWSVMKSEIITAIPNAAAAGGADGRADGRAHYKSVKSNQFPYTYWNDSDLGTDKWHRRINVSETLKQLDDRFNFGTSSGISAQKKGLLRSPSQICEIHLVPTTEDGSLTNIIGSDGDKKMGTFWGSHALTGDNTRERPYSGIYPKLTTRSNTFRIHLRTQVIKKARSTSADHFDPVADQVLSEYRGSTLIERYIDPNDTANPLPNYASDKSTLSKPTLDSFYRFRVLETKRFSP